MNNRAKLAALNILVYIALMTTFVPWAYAIDSTPSSSPPSDIKQKLKALQDEIASKAAELKNEISKKLLNRTYIGYIKSKSTDSVTLATLTGSKIINISDFTEYKANKPKAGKVTLSNFDNEDYIAALGDADENGVLTAKRIIKIDNPPTEIIAIFGTVISLGQNNIRVSAKENPSYNFGLTQSTDYLLGKAAITVSGIKSGQTVIVIAEKQKSSSTISKDTTPKDGSTDIPKARMIYIFPGSLITAATSSATTPVSNASSSTKIVSPSPKPKKS